MKARAQEGGAGTLWLMLLPVAALGAWAWKSSTRTSQGPSHVVVRSVEHEALAPRDVGQGFDTRVKVTLGYEGARPRGWGEASEAQYSLSGPSIPDIESKAASQDTQEAPRSRSGGYDVALDAYTNTYLLRLRGVPHGEPIVLTSYFWSQERKPHVAESRDVKALAWRAVVREAGEKTPPLPKVSHYCPLKVRSVEFFDRRKPNSSWGFHVEVACELGAPLVDGESALHKFRIAMDDAYLEDKQGHRWQNTAYSPRADSPLDPVLGTVVFYDWDISKPPLPAKLDGLTFRALISLGDSWPLEVRVPVRNVR